LSKHGEKLLQTRAKVCVEMRFEMALEVAVQSVHLKNCYCLLTTSSLWTMLSTIQSGP